MFCENQKERGKEKKVNYSKHSESVENINKEAKLAVTHSANVAGLWAKGPQEQANNAAWTKRLKSDRKEDS